jgi:nitrogen fixation/metabolism regulation signal transduction histidine kinase
MAKVSEIRGSGVRLTLPYVLRFSGLWLVVTSVAIVLFGVACYAVGVQATDDLAEPARRNLGLVLAAQTLALLAGAVALAVFTTHRIAGPFIALRRAFDQVRDGTLERPLRLRTSDTHLKELEASFNEMAAAVRQRLEGSAGAGRAGSEGASGGV